MKKEVIIFLLLGVLLISPLVMAQEQAKVYSGFNRFVDNVKMFFSSGDNKVMLSLEIRNKELDSAIANTISGEEEKAEKNLERARERLQYVQKKVSKNIADNVTIDINGTIDKINNENLSNTFESYVLEEQKTQLVAKLVIEVEGKEGQTLTREIVKDNSTGKNKVEVVVRGDDGQIRTIEIEQAIQQVQNQIAERIIVERQIKEGNSNGDDGLEVEVKTHIEGDGTDEEPLPTPDLNQINPDIAPKDTTTNNIDEAPGGKDSGYAEGTTENRENNLAD